MRITLADCIAARAVLSAVPATPDPRDQRIERLEEVLEKIARWEIPDTGETWPSGGPVSYEAAYGSNGARDYMRQVAAAALAEVRNGEKAQTP